MKEKDSLPYRMTRESPMAVQQELLRRFRLARRPQPQADKADGRTVKRLLQNWEQRTLEKRRVAAEKEAREEARHKKEAAQAHQEHLDELAQREPQAWQQAEALIQTRRPKSYDEAVQLLRDLRDLAERERRSPDALARLRALREKHRAKPSLLRRMDAAKL